MTEDGLVGVSDPFMGTLYDNFRHAAELHPDRPCLGARTKRPDGSFGDYQFVSYKDVVFALTDIGSAIVGLGMRPGTAIGVYSVNRPEWVVVEQACNAYGYPTVALYDSLGPNAVHYIAQHAELPIIFCAGENLDKMLSACAAEGGLPNLRYIVALDDPKPEQRETAARLDKKLLTFGELRQSGHEHRVPHNPPKPNDLAILMYTSGTTGDPKGVMLTHANMISTVEAVVLHGIDLRPTDVHFSYLPLAHSFERTVVTAMLRYGAAIGFFSSSILRMRDDIAALRPTIFCGVPRVFSRLYDRIMQQIAQAGGYRQALFHYAFATRQAALAGGQDTPLMNRIVFDKLKGAMGGRVRMMLTGSAPIDMKVLEFLRVCFCPTVLQGYGLTETCAASAITNVDDTALGRVGAPLACNEYKLVSVPEMDYLVTNDPPRGELWIRGNNVFSGYYKDRRRTEEDLDQDGWFHTGDVGQWNADGTLSIVDRKKNIFKLAQGEYVAVEQVENIYVKSRYVEQVFIYGDSFKTFLVAIVVPDREAVGSFADASAGGARDFEALCASAALRDAIFKDMVDVGRAGKLRGFEIVKGILLLAEPFSVDNDLMTPTFKLRRVQITKKFKPQLDALIAEVERAEAAAAAAAGASARDA